MTHAMITLSGDGVRDIQNLTIQISVEASVHITEKTARRQATIWLASEAGNMLMAGAPQLVISQNTVWRFPVLMTSSQKGVVGEVGNVDVDATTGELLVSDELKAQIVENARQLASPTLSPVG